MVVWPAVQATRIHPAHNNRSRAHASQMRPTWPSAQIGGDARFM